MSENAWYYLDESTSGLAGSMRTGWVEWNQKWYYLSEASDQSNGKMLSNTLVGGYKLGVDGAWEGTK